MSGTTLTSFSDFTCPFSYVTEAALRPVADEAGIVVAYRAYELFPVPAPLPAVREPPEREEPLRLLAEAAGVRLRPPAYRARTRKAHEAAHFARQHGREAPLRHAIYRAYWEEGLDIGRIDVLCQLARGVGFDPEDVRIALDIDAFTDAVLADREFAERLGIRHTPTLVVGEGEDARFAVGALSAAELREFLTPPPSA